MIPSLLDSYYLEEPNGRDFKELSHLMSSILVENNYFIIIQLI